MRITRWPPQFTTPRTSEESNTTSLDATVSPAFAQDAIKPPPGYLWVVRQACQPSDLELEPNQVERLWRAASGSAHGMYWPTQELQKLVEVTSQGGESRRVRVADALGIAEVLTASYRMTQYAVLKYADFAGADIWSLMRASRVWLAEKITVREDADPTIVNRLRNGDESPDR